MSKKRHETEQDAIAFIKTLGNSSSKFSAYKCEVCQHWHLATDYTHIAIKRIKQKEKKQGKINREGRELRLKTKKKFRGRR